MLMITEALIISRKRSPLTYINNCNKTKTEIKLDQRTLTQSPSRTVQDNKLIINKIRNLMTTTTKPGQLLHYSDQYRIMEVGYHKLSCLVSVLITSHIAESQQRDHIYFRILPAFKFCSAKIF